MNANKQIQPNLHAIIGLAIRKNRAELPFLLKNPLTDFLSFGVRRELTTKAVGMAIVGLAGMNPATRRYKARLAEVVKYPGPAMNAIEKYLLVQPNWTTLPTLTHRLLDVLEDIGGGRALGLVGAAAKLIETPQVKARALLIVKRMAKAERLRSISEAHGTTAMAQISAERANDREV